MDTIAVAVFAFAVIAAFLARDMLRSRSSQAAAAPGGVEDCMASIRNELQGVRTAIERSDAGMTAQLRLFGQQTASLTETTSALRSVLGSAHARGQWGERMAEDVLRAIGFVEGVNYAKQQTLDGSGARPDFVFPLPGGLRMNMDVKFPLDNYARAAKLPGGAERVELEKAFLRDVRARVREVSSREYVDPEGGTVAYAVLFIPNESVFAYIQEHAPELFEAALRDRVVCCSPLTLFAVLAIVRQTVDSFRLQKASLSLGGSRRSGASSTRASTPLASASTARVLLTTSSRDPVAGCLSVLWCASTRSVRGVASRSPPSPPSSLSRRRASPCAACARTTPWSLPPATLPTC